MKEFPKSDYKEYPKQLRPDDFWGQVRRTVNGKPISEEQINFILGAIKNGLALKKSDCLLDIACGNGCLASYFFDDIESYLGVDFSEYLISVADKNFARLPNFLFSLGDAAGYIRSEKYPERFTKALCYGSFSFFSKQDAFDVLLGLSKKFINLERIFIGNLPDRARAANFYPKGKDYTQEVNLAESQIGIWRSVSEFEELAKATGWDIRFSYMPDTFYAAHYRFDVILDRNIR